MDSVIPVSTNLCVVCQVPISTKVKESAQTEENIKILWCKHIFHDNCINTWLKIKNICPICRAEDPENQSQVLSMQVSLSAEQRNESFAELVNRVEYTQQRQLDRCINFFVSLLNRSIFQIIVENN